MVRPIVYDVTHLIERITVKDPTGIDRVDLAYGCHFARAQRSGVFGSQYGLRGPRVISVVKHREIVRRAEAGWREHVSLDADQSFAAVNGWLDGKAASGRLNDRPIRKAEFARSLMDYLWSRRSRLAGITKSVPRDAIYLNVAQFWLELPRYFAWLEQRDDVRVVFFVHDLLPLDYPEYFRPGYRVLFQRRFKTLARWGGAFIVSSDAVGERLRKGLKAAQRPQVPIHVAALPSPLASITAPIADDDLGGQPYFVLISTIEPRKNHLLVLNIWRELAADNRCGVPKLVLVGGSGWEHEQVTDMLDRCEAIRPYVFHTTRLSSAGLARLLAGAQALLMPSFDEGYGLPIVEALALGTPVIASDIATFHEITQGCALLLSPLDGLRWKEAINAFSQRESPAWKLAKSKAAGFRAPDWQKYFHGIEGFLDSLWTAGRAFD